MKNKTLNRRQALGLLAGAGALTAAACTNTRYLVRNPDGTYSEVTPPEESGDGYYEEHDDAVTVQVHTASPYFVVGEQVHLMVVVQGPAQAPTRRAPMDVGLVLDRSGSMTGGKLEGAKDAAAHLVQQLADGDRVSLASYATDVSYDLPLTTINRRSRASFRHTLEHMFAAGGTNLEGGLRAGFRQLQSGRDQELLSRVVLMSDGKANVGETSVQRLAGMADLFAERGVSLTTMGLGYDYNEDLMTSLAVAGSGNYYYVEHSNGLSRSFREEILGFGATVGRDVELLLELPPGVRVDDVYGYRFQQQGRQLKVRMSNVMAAQRQRLMVSLSPGGRSVGTPVSLGRPTLTYRHESTKQRRRVRFKAIHVTPTQDRRLAGSNLNKAVVEKLETVRNAAVRKSVMLHMDKGDYGSAQRVLDERHRQGSSVARKVDSASVKKQLRELDDMRRAVKSRPAPASKGYKHFRKSRSKEAFDMYRR